DQRVARQVEVDAAQVVLAGALDDQAVSHAAPLDKTLSRLQPILRMALPMLCAHTDKQPASSTVTHMTRAGDDDAGASRDRGVAP
ncbi:MAG TPA: hypothetical protein VMC78_00195, partial [Mycobacterium sp.]|nr:hypothetical protein [Mycobacterium sp.]